jgi:signal transduction histidine kinase
VTVAARRATPGAGLEDGMPSILIVDDELGLLSSLVMAFETQGYRSAGAASAAEALELLRGASFDVLLTDLVMPGMDGLSLMDQVRADFPEMVIILMTGGATVESAVRALKGGASDYVVKPFRLAEIFHIVERCREQRGLERENLQLGEVNRRLQELDRLKSNLLSAVSHEFRTPLTIMHGWLDLLMQGQFGPISPEQRESLSAVHKSAVRLDRLIANLLAFVEYERGQGAGAVGAVRVDSLLQKAAAELAADCAERQVTLGVDAASALPTLQGDAERLRLLFLNLLENAVKFNEPGGTVLVTAREDAKRLEVRVANSHGTIPSEHIESLLQPFTQGDMGPRRPAGGLGLGLAVARAIVDAHGGELHLEANEGQGTTVRVRLPLATDAK